MSVLGSVTNKWTKGEGKVEEKRLFIIQHRG